MAGKPKRMSKIKQLLRLHRQGYKTKTIARELLMSKNTVKSYLLKYQSSKLSIETLLSMDDPVLEKVFLPGNPAYKDQRFEELKSKFPYYEKELKRKGVTQKLLWEEYRQEYPQGYSLSQFCFHISQYLLSKTPSLVLTHRAGEKFFIDFAGQKLSYVDKDTGEIISCQVFVGSLPYSDYGFCLAVPSQKTADFLYALSCSLKFLGGTPKILVPDNLKSAVIKADKYEPELNTVLEDFANHYNMTVLPARARKPQDKALVENQVRLIYSRVYAPLRNRVFFSLSDLNEAIAEKMKKHNQTRMQQKNYSREECFLSEEKELLGALPETDFEIKYYKEYKVAKNNHIYLTVDKHYYSVPYQHIGQKVKVIYTRSMVRIYLKGEQVAIHQRDYRPGKYSTLKDHLCSTHRYYLDRSPDYYKNRAAQIDASFEELTRQIFSQDKYPEQLYRTCDGLFALQRKTEPETFRKACNIALKFGNYSYKFLLNVIQNRMTDYDEDTSGKASLPEHKNIRGASHYSNE